MDDKSRDDHAKQIRDAILKGKQQRFQDAVNGKFQSAEEEAEYEKFAAQMMAMEQSHTVPVRDFIGNPELRSPEELLPEQIEAELERIQAILLAHNLVADFLGEWTAEQAYHRIYYTMLDEETTAITMPGMMSHFSFTSPAYDAEMGIDMFIMELFRSGPEFFFLNWCNDELYDGSGQPATEADLMQQALRFRAIPPLVKRYQYEIVSLETDRMYATAQIKLLWSRASGVQSYVATFRMKQVDIPEMFADVVQTDLLDLLLAGTDGPQKG